VNQKKRLGTLDISKVNEWKQEMNDQVHKSQETLQSKSSNRVNVKISDVTSYN